MSEQGKKWGPWEHDRYEPGLYVRHYTDAEGNEHSDVLGLDYLNELEQLRPRAALARKAREAVDRGQDRVWRGYYIEQWARDYDALASSHGEQS